MGFLTSTENFSCHQAEGAYHIAQDCYTIVGNKVVLHTEYGEPIMAIPETSVSFLPNGKMRVLSNRFDEMPRIGYCAVRCSEGHIMWASAREPFPTHCWCGAPIVSRV